MKIVFAADFGIYSVKDEYDPTIVSPGLDEAKRAMENADFRMLNLEKLFYFGGEPILKSGPNIGMRKEYISALKHLKIDAVGLANNHTGDFGESNVLKNLNYLKENSIAYVGGGKNKDEAYLPLVFEKDGVAASVITICENEFGTATDSKAGAAGFELYRTVKLIKDEKANGRYVIVNFHGGNEENPFPSPKKRGLYRTFIECGADAVIAMHTHCPQGYEYYLGKPIIYSMGNFFFAYKDPQGERANMSSAYYFGYMSKLDIKDGKVSFEPIPYRFTPKGMTVMDGDDKRRFLYYLEKISEPIKSDKEIEAYFRGWSLITGPIYANFLNFDRNNIPDKDLLRHIKNNFSCEAHNELLESYIRMLFDGITDEDEKRKAEIRAMSTIDLQKYDY